MATHLDRRNNLSLDSLNFFLADVRDGLGPYLAIYLLAVHHWDPAFGPGAALSNGFARWVVEAAGYRTAFLTLAAVAAVALVLLWIAFPETLQRSAESGTHRSELPSATVP